MFNLLLIRKGLQLIQNYFVDKINHEQLRELLNYFLNDVLGKTIKIITDKEPDRPQFDALFIDIKEHLATGDDKLAIAILRKIIKDEAVLNEIIDLIHKGK